MPDISKNDNGFIWLNGEFVKWNDAKVHFFTHALHYATSVFEGERAYNGRIFKMREHHERLLRSAEILDMKCDYTVEQIDKIVMECLEKSGLKNAYVRPLIWRGSETMGIFSRNTSVNFGVAIWDWPAYFEGDIMTKGISLGWAPWSRPDPATAPVEAKASGLYMISVLSKNHAFDRGFTDALMKDYRGYVAEATGANIFFAFGGELHTPNPKAFLNGITRQTVIGIAERAGIKVVVRDITPEEIAKADEVFITGTGVEIVPIGKIEDMTFPVGPITKMIRSEYMKMVNQA
ncbi:MAG: branched-chain amino acid aminotransferase [Alphaproteobacteria bacterium]|nr:branched-chain amino acid aminotransferase [Alphaproteobacteria bacterium]